VRGIKSSAECDAHVCTELHQQSLNIIRNVWCHTYYIYAKLEFNDGGCRSRWRKQACYGAIQVVERAIGAVDSSCSVLLGIYSVCQKL